MAESLTSKTLRAMSWTFLEAVGLRITQLVVAVVLAWLLEVEEFGLIGMLAVFIAVAQSLLDSGFGAALIQKREISHVDTCSIFYFNIAAGIVAAGLLCLASPWIADFYEQPMLVPLARALSAVIVINSFALVQTSVLTRELNFKLLTKANLVARFFSGIIAVSLAALGFGVWSLVLQQISNALLVTLILWFANPWRPSLVFSFRALGAMFGFGSRVMASGVLAAIFDNIYGLVIGKLFSARDLGFFSQAKKVQELPVQSLSWTVGRVTFPVFSSIQDDRERVKRGLHRVLTSLAFLNFPVMAGILVTARPLVGLLLREKWLPCVPYLQILCVLGLLYPMNWFNVNVLYSLGRSDLCFRLEIIKRILVVAAIAISYRWGITAMIWGQVVVSFLSYWLNGYYNGVLIGYPVREQLRDLLPYVMAPVLMGLGVYLIGEVPLMNAWGRLLTQIFTGIVLYAVLSWLLRLPRFFEMVQIIGGKVRSLGPRRA